MLGIDEAKVTAWLDAHVEGIHSPYEFELIAGGRSNVTYRVIDAAGRVFVVRRPPLGHVLATAHDMAREHRLITAIGTTNVPVPRISLTPSCLLDALALVVHATGAAKWPLWQQAEQGGACHTLPIRFVLAQQTVPVHLFYSGS